MAKLQYNQKILAVVFVLVAIFPAVYSQASADTTPPTNIGLIITDSQTTAKAGDILTYRIMAKNFKRENMANVKVVVHIPDYLIPLETSPAALADPQLRSLTWEKQTIPAGTVVTFAFRAQVQAQIPAGLQLNSQAEISGPGFQGSAKDVTTIQLPSKVSRPLSAATSLSKVSVRATAKTGSDSIILLAVSSMIVGWGGGLCIFRRKWVAEGVS